MNSNLPPAISGLAAALRVLLIAVGAGMVVFHWDHSAAYEWVDRAAGIVLVAVPAVWAVWVAGVSAYRNLAAAVQAGINLTISGRAVDSDGNAISRFATDATPPKQVTLASAGQIIKSFAPSPAEIEKK